MIRMMDFSEETAIFHGFDYGPVDIRELPLCVQVSYRKILPKLIEEKERISKQEKREPENAVKQLTLF